MALDTRAVLHPEGHDVTGRCGTASSRATLRVWLCMVPAVLASCESCVPSGEQYVDVPLERSEVVALHDPPRVVVRTFGEIGDSVGRSDNRSSETEHLGWAEPAARILSGIRGAQYISVERDGAVDYLALHRGAADLPETALSRNGEGWRIVRQLSVGMRRDHAVVARWGNDGRLEPRRHPAAEAWIERLKEKIGRGADAERVAKAVVALGADATALVRWYFERERSDADELVTAVAALCTGDVDLALRIAPRERNLKQALCLRLPDGSAEVCGRGAWVRVGDDHGYQSSPPAQGEALREIDPPTDAIAGALSLCGGPRLQANLQRGLAAMLAGNIEVALALRRHEPDVLQQAVEQLDVATRPTARLLLGFEQDEAEAARAMSSPALVPTLAALECFNSTLQVDGFVLYDPQRDGFARMEAMLADGPLASRVVAFSILPALGPDADAAVVEARGRAMARLYVDLSTPDDEALPQVNALYRCSYIPHWPATRGGMSRQGGFSPEIVLWDTRIALMQRVADLPESGEIDALLATSRRETLRWAAAYARTGASDSTEIRRVAERAICTCDIRQIREFGSPGASECGLIDSAARRHEARVDWRSILADIETLCARPQGTR